MGKSDPADGGIAAKAYAEYAFGAYLECAVWASMHGNQPLDKHWGVGDIDSSAREAMRAEFNDFLDLLDREGVDYSEVWAEQMGHDFWLTRNRHGAGFWDRGLGALGDELTKWAHSFGESDLYVGDDGKVYVYPT